MAASWSELSEILGALESELGVDEMGLVAALAFGGLGGPLWQDARAPHPTMEELLQMEEDGTDVEAMLVLLERRIELLAAEEYISEDVLIAGTIAHVTKRLEEYSEESTRYAAENRQDLDLKRIELQDPIKREEQAQKVNTLRAPTGPNVTADDMLPSLERLIMKYAQPATLRQLQEARRRLDTWRNVTTAFTSRSTSLEDWATRIVPSIPGYASPPPTSSSLNETG